ELMEETNMGLKDLKQFHVYSDPKRDPRFHTVSVVFTAKSDMAPKAGDDAAETKLFTRDEIIKMNSDGLICFDHGLILSDYFTAR
ncbi:MAG: NUDIX hydrolase, partial [Proteobacteria bacterium]|nr:NUDIX hydrolase [Pseudomonadota bacterium]